MIHDLIRGDVFATDERMIAFAVNAEGHNDAGFAGLVSSRYWRAIADTGPQEQGTVLTLAANVNGNHPALAAIVCHSLGDAGWADAPLHIESGLNRLEVPDDTTVAVVLMGAGMIGQMQGADPLANLGAIARAKPACHVYTL